MIVKAERWVQEPDENACGMLLVSTVDTSVEFPLLVDTHNVSLEDVKIGQEQEFDFIFECIGAFNVFKDEEDYYKNRKYSMASQSVIPSGLFPTSNMKAEEFEQTPTAIVKGIVNDVVEDPTKIGFEKDDILFSIDCLNWDINCITYKSIIGSTKL